MIANIEVNIDYPEYEDIEEMTNSMILSNISDIENEINKLDYNLKAVEDKLYLSNKNKISIEEFINSRRNTINDINNNYK